MCSSAGLVVACRGCHGLIVAERRATADRLELQHQLTSGHHSCKVRHAVDKVATAVGFFGG